ncbi:hypothetical protein AB0L40_10960 [Patulibacter sp. NPDC049589]|uniref:hypothetical protein n=1 Tax=Patulibacter sp. NPDC049589 TaxID=3154731 RepID=UPI0034431ED4
MSRKRRWAFRVIVLVAAIGIYGLYVMSTRGGPTLVVSSWGERPSDLQPPRSPKVVGPLRIGNWQGAPVQFERFTPTRHRSCVTVTDWRVVPDIRAHVAGLRWRAITSDALPGGRGAKVPTSDKQPTALYLRIAPLPGCSVSSGQPSELRVEYRRGNHSGLVTTIVGVTTR